MLYFPIANQQMLSSIQREDNEAAMLRMSEVYDKFFLRFHHFFNCRNADIKAHKHSLIKCKLKFVVLEKFGRFFKNYSNTNFSQNPLWGVVNQHRQFLSCQKTTQKERAFFSLFVDKNGKISFFFFHLFE